MGLAQKILTFGNYIYQGFAVGTQPIFGFNFGSKNYKRMLEILKAGIIIVTCIEVSVMMVFGIFAKELIAIFSDNVEVIGIGVKVLRALMCILPFVGATSMCRMAFQAMGKPQFAFFITLIRQLILYIPLLLVLNWTFGFKGLIWAQPISELIMMLVAVSILVSYLKHYENEKN